MKPISVDVLVMKTSKPGADYFVRVKCGDRGLTPHVFRERWKAEYEVAQWQFLFGLIDEEPDILLYNETNFPQLH